MKSLFEAAAKRLAENRRPAIESILNGLFIITNTERMFAEAGRNGPLAERAYWSQCAGEEAGHSIIYANDVVRLLGCIPMEGYNFPAGLLLLVSWAEADTGNLLVWKTLGEYLAISEDFLASFEGLKQYLPTVVELHQRLDKQHFLDDLAALERFKVSDIPARLSFVVHCLEYRNA